MMERKAPPLLPWVLCPKQNLHCYMSKYFIKLTLVSFLNAQANKILLLDIGEVREIIFKTATVA